jgi:deazaflavin-dependent oxidoreductase (nitroreductase family)
MPLDPGLATQQLCHLETVGRHTARPHTIEMWFAADPQSDRLYLLAGGRDDSDWVLNVRANPSVRIRISGQTLSGRAHVIEGEPDELRARHLVGGKYGYWTEGTPLSGWARDSLPLAIDLDPPA